MEWLVNQNEFVYMPDLVARFLKMIAEMLDGIYKTKVREVGLCGVRPNTLNPISESRSSNTEELNPPVFNVYPLVGMVSSSGLATGRPFEVYLHSLEGPLG